MDEQANVPETGNIELKNLVATSKGWLKFFSIIDFVGVAFSLIGIIFLIGMPNIIRNMYIDIDELKPMLRMYIATYIPIFLIAAGILFWRGILLLKASRSGEHYVVSGTSEGLVGYNKKLKNLFTFVGILTIIRLILAVIGIILAIAAVGVVSQMNY